MVMATSAPASDLWAAREGSGYGWLIDVPEGRAAQRLAVYVNGYPARIEQALEEQFPALAHIVGADAFAALVQRYIAAVPLHSYNLNDAGAGLPEFLRTDRLTPRLPFLPDLAQLEWRVARAFHAHEHTPADPSAFVDWSVEDWTGAVLRFQPSVALVCSDWPIREIWDARETLRADIDIDLRNRPDRVLVRRSGYTVLCESLDDTAARCLAALLEGQTLGRVAEALVANSSDPASVFASFARWMELRMITGCERTAS